MTFDKRRRRVHRNPVVLLSVADIAERFQFHPNTIRSWLREGLRAYRGGRGPGGGKIYVREDDLLDFLARTYGPPEDEGDEDDDHE